MIFIGAINSTYTDPYISHTSICLSPIQIRSCKFHQLPSNRSRQKLQGLKGCQELPNVFYSVKEPGVQIKDPETLSCNASCSLFPFFLEWQRWMSEIWISLAMEAPFWWGRCSIVNPWNFIWYIESYSPVNVVSCGHPLLCCFTIVKTSFLWANFSERPNKPNISFCPAAVTHGSNK